MLLMMFWMFDSSNKDGNSAIKLLLREIVGKMAVSHARFPCSRSMSAIDNRPNDLQIACTTQIQLCRSTWDDFYLRAGQMRANVALQRGFALVTHPATLDHLRRYNSNFFLLQHV